ncbi:MAG: DUF3168 domain-containing protein [Planctomycetaceae bacterium]|nr:DUF3168 domain-containing protein [Planctomycetaceae bacterium]
MVEEGLFTLFSTTAGITALIGAGAACRAYPMELPQDETLPALVYSRISGVPEHHLTGRANIGRARFQVDCYAATPAEVKALKEAVREALDHYSGAPAGEKIHAIYLESDRDFSEPSVDLYHVTLDFAVLHDE